MQTSGKLAAITDSVFFNNNHSSAYTEANNRSVFDPSNNNVLLGSALIDLPIVSITRASQVIKGGLGMSQVTSLDPRPANTALTSVAAAPADGFFTPAQYRGAFAPNSTGTWLGDWTASYAFGFTPFANGATNYCTAGTTSNGCQPPISGSGWPSATKGSGFTITVSNVEGQKQGLIFYGVAGTAAAPWGTGTSFLCVKAPTQRTQVQNSGGNAGLCNGTLAVDWNEYIATHPGALGQPFAGGETVYAQGWFRDPPASKTTNLSNALQFTVNP